MKRIWYLYLKVSVFLTAMVYFRRVERNGMENIPRQGPVILGTRHSNALMDPLTSGVYVPRTLHFLVRADVFKNAFIRKIWASMNMMPIYRIRDGREAMSQNAVIFERCHQILRNGGSLEIFPEGGHSPLNKLPSLKKGAARIALGALDGMTRENDIPIVPVGLNYSSQKAFRGHLSVNYGPPISTREDFDPTDPLSPRAVRSLTDKLEAGLRKEVLDLRLPAPYEEMNALRQTLEIHYAGIKIPDFALSKGICEKIVDTCQQAENREKLLELQAEHASLREKTQLSEAGLRATPITSSELLSKQILHAPLLLMLPIGMLIHAPMLIPASRSPRLIKDAIFFSALRFISGMFLGQLLYLLYFVLAWILIGNFWWALAAIAGSALLGTIAIAAYDAWTDLRRLGKLSKVERKFPKECQRMRELQVDIEALLGGKAPTTIQ